MKVLITVALLAASLVLSNAILGVQFTSQSDKFPCLYEQGFTYLNALAVYGTSFYTSALANMQLAAANHMTSNVLLQPSNSYLTTQLAQDLSSKIPSSYYDSIIISTQYFSSSVKQKNCEYLVNLTSVLRVYFPGHTIMFQSSKQQWSDYIGGYCDGLFTNFGLSYVSQNNVPSFSDWPSVEFGGWAYPQEKLWSSVYVCGASSNLLYRQF